MKIVGSERRVVEKRLRPTSSPDFSQCMLCRDKRPFVLPEALVKAVESAQLVVFAGAGISTESKRVFPTTLYDELKGDLKAGLARKLPAKASFAAVASVFETAFGRRRLIQAIRARLDYALAFPELYWMATAFHRELSTIPSFDSIITTNWDTYFEDEAGAIPIVIPEDYAFWDLPGRKVFKIHGSVTNLSTIVATREDYSRCLRRLRTGLIGSSLRHLLATQSALFVGYSFGDEDFNQVYGLLKREMKEILPRSFIVTLDHRITPETHPSASIFHTDAAFFLGELKRRLVRDHIMISDKRFDDIHRIRLRVSIAHKRLDAGFPIKKYPTAIYAASYQDGLAHGFDRIVAKKKTGEYSHAHDVVRKALSYDAAEKIALREKRYLDAAYIRGYSNALIYVLMKNHERTALPLFFAFGERRDLRNITGFRKAVQKAAETHKGAFRAATKLAARAGPGLVFHHEPFLKLAGSGNGAVARSPVATRRAKGRRL